MKNLLTALALILGSTLMSHAQESLEPKASPMYMTRASVGDAQLSIVYSRPHMKNRTIFGELVPYGEVWRLGANEAVLVTLTADLNFAGTVIPAGSYNLFAIPGEEEWTFIFSSQTNQWGAYRYDESKDVARITVPVSESEAVYEPFTITATGEGSEYTINFMWDRTMVSIPVTQG